VGASLRHELRRRHPLVIQTSDFRRSCRGLPVGMVPVGIGVSPDSSQGVRDQHRSNTISIVDAALRTTVGTIDVSTSRNPAYQSASQTCRRFRPTDRSSTSSSSTIVLRATIDVATGSMTQTISMGQQFTKVAYIPSLAKLYILSIAPT